jgi:hypothetical protein
VHEEALPVECDDLAAQLVAEGDEPVVLQRLELLLVVEVGVGLPGDDDALGPDLGRLGVGLPQPVDVCRQPGVVLGLLAGDLGVRARLAVDAGVREVVVGAWTSSVGVVRSEAGEARRGVRAARCRPVVRWWES